MYICLCQGVFIMEGQTVFSVRYVLKPKNQ